MIFRSRYNCLGIGENGEEAERNLYDNLCMKDLKYDVEGLYVKRRNELCPWFPQNNLLHISRVGALLWDGEKIINTKTGKSVYVAQKRYSIYYYLSHLFSNELSYTDISICLRPELDKFFKNISTEFESIFDYPRATLISIENGFKTTEVYTYENGILVGINESMVGVKLIGEKYFTGMELESNIGIYHLLAYLGYIKGVLINEKGVNLIGKQG